MSELPIPDWLDGSMASFLSSPEETTDTLNPQSLLPDNQFVTTVSSYNNGSNGSMCNSSNALVSDFLLYEDPSLPLEIDMHPPAQLPIQPTPNAAAASRTGLQNSYQGGGFLSENVRSESAPGSIRPMDVYTDLAVDDECPASEHIRASVTSKGHTNHAQKKRKRSSVEADSLICDWPDCKRNQPFNRLHDLRRHRRDVHKLRGSYPHGCPFDGCDQSYKRKDNLQRHIRQCHQKATNANESSRGS